MICSANQWTGFYMITVSVMKELIDNLFKVNKKGTSASFKVLALRLFLLTRIPPETIRNL